MTNQKDTVIIVSGGIDSITLLYEFSSKIALAVSFDYGRNHNDKEIPFARYHCEKLGIPHVTINLEFMKTLFNSSLLSGDDAIPDADYDEDNMHSTVVPFRNGIMLSIAAGLAENNGLKRVMMANHGGDHSIYPDCRPEFVNSMDNAIKHGTYEGVRLFTPYTNITKTDIVKKGIELGVDYSHTWSCYRGGDKHCGTCGTCRERKLAFAELNVSDPTDYIV